MLVGINMSYEVESKKEILIRERIFNMFLVVSKDLFWFIYIIILGEFCFILVIMCNNGGVYELKCYILFCCIRYLSRFVFKR